MLGHHELSSSDHLQGVVDDMNSSATVLVFVWSGSPITDLISLTPLMWRALLDAPAVG